MHRYDQRNRQFSFLMRLQLLTADHLSLLAAYDIMHFVRIIRIISYNMYLLFRIFPLHM